MSVMLAKDFPLAELAVDARLISSLHPNVVRPNFILGAIP